MARIRSVKPSLFGSEIAEELDRCGRVASGFYPEREVIVYRFLDADHALLYVGVTGNATDRWTTHKRTAPWWSRVRWLVTEKRNGMVDALGAERDAIRTECPLFNVRSA